MERYLKQVLYKNIDKEGQQKLKDSKVIVIGCGALGTVIANNLARTGVGYIKLVDRDYIELSNLQRQMLFDEDDIEQGLPKVIAAKNKLEKINSDITVESEIADVNSSNILKLCEGMDLILDGTDNFKIRYLINDTSIHLNIPWIYGAAIGSTGMVHTVIPKETPCLRCIFPQVPAAGSVDTCDTIGVLNGITSIIASLQTTEAVKILVGKKEEIIKKMRFIDIWTGDYEEIPVQIQEQCCVCGNEEYEFLSDKHDEVIHLCGKDSIQVNYGQGSISADSIVNRLSNSGIEVKRNSFYLKFNVEDVQVTLFYDGRAMFKGISDGDIAKSIYRKYIGI